MECSETFGTVFNQATCNSDITAIVLDNNNNPLKFTDLKAGLTVDISAGRRADGSLLATKIKIDDRLGIQGKVVTVGAHGLSVAGLAIAFDANTQFRDASNRPLMKQELRPDEPMEGQAAQPTPSLLVACW